MTIDSINDRSSSVIEAASTTRAVSDTQQRAFESQLNNSVQPRHLVDQANQALVNGEPKLAAWYLGEAAQKISGGVVVVSTADNY